MDEKKLQRLTKLFEITNEGLTRKEFVASFKKVMEMLHNLKAEVLASIDFKETQERNKLVVLQRDFKHAINDADKTMAKLVDGKFNASNSKLEKQLEALKRKDKEIDAKIASIRNGKPGTPGRDADETKIVDKVFGMIKVPEVDTREIEELREQLAALRRSKSLGGGGFSKIAMEGKFIDDETPSGAINGSNTAFTVAFAPNPVSSLKVFVNGARMRITEDYTFSGKTITFTTAPPTNSIILVDYRK